MQQILTRAIVLSRTEYGEADRIITLLTPEQGKVRVMARGVRRAKSKLAGGIELFSSSDITYIKGRGEIGTLVSARLETHYGQIVKDVTRTMLGYELIKQLNRATEDATETDYYDLLQESFAALDNANISAELIRFWFDCQLLRLAGFSPNMVTDTNGQRLAVNTEYTFNFDEVAFEVLPAGRYAADHIKFMRLAFNGNPPRLLQQIQGGEGLLEQLLPIVQTLFATYIQR